MRVLVVSDIPYPRAVNGVSIYLDDLTGRLTQRGFEVALFCQGKGPGRTRLLSDKSNGVSRHTLLNSPIHYKKALYDPLPGLREPGTEYAFRDVMGRVRPGIVHFHEFVRTPVSLLHIAREFGAKVVLTLHDYWLICPRLILFTPDEKVCPGPDGGRNCLMSCVGSSALTRIYRRLSARDSFFVKPLKRLRDGVKCFKREPLGQRPFRGVSKSPGNLKLTGLLEKLALREEGMRRAMNFAHLILPVSSRVGEIFKSHGVKEELLSPLNLGLPGIEGLSYRERSPRRPLVVGFLGHLGPAKGSHLLVEAARGFSPDEARVLIYGGGDEHARAEIVKTSRSLPNLSYLGPYRRERLGAILDGLDVLVFPSIWEETLGLAAMEALAAGVPVVASRIGGVTDYVKDGINGLLFSPGSVEELAEKIRGLVDDPDAAAELSRGARDTVLDMEAHTDRLAEIYRGLGA